MIFVMILFVILQILYHVKHFYILVQAFQVGVSFVMDGMHAIQMFLGDLVQTRHRAVEPAEVVTSEFDVPSVAFHEFPACRLCLIIAALGFASVALKAHLLAHGGRLQYNSKCIFICIVFYSFLVVTLLMSVFVVFSNHLILF